MKLVCLYQQKQDLVFCLALKKQEKDLTEQEFIDRMNKWSRKMFGYTKNEKYYRGDSNND